MKKRNYAKKILKRNVVLFLTMQFLYFWLLSISKRVTEKQHWISHAYFKWFALWPLPLDWLISLMLSIMWFNYELWYLLVFCLVDSTSFYSPHRASCNWVFVSHLTELGLSSFTKCSLENQILCALLAVFLFLQPSCLNKLILMIHCLA